jgi:ATP-dependent DNA helicase 2 subunit 2
MGEIYYIWPEPDSPTDQVQLSALVQAMIVKDQFALVRWAQKETSAPKIGAAVGAIDDDNVEYLIWVQVSASDPHGMGACCGAVD